MADFCKTYDPESHDVDNLCESGEMVLILCEGCGEQHFVDHEGYRVPQAERGSDHG